MALSKTSFVEEVVSNWRGVSRPQQWLFVLYALLLILYTLNFLRAIENRIGLSFFIPISDAFFIIMAVIGGFSAFLKKIRIRNLIFLLVVMLVYGISMYANEDTRKFALDNAPRFFGSCLPLFLIGLTIDKKTPISIFVVLAYIALFFHVLFLSILGMGVDSEGKERIDAMSESYALLPFTCLLLYNALSRKGLIHWAIAMIAVFVNMSYGTRGPIICMVFFLAVYLILFKHYKNDVLVKIIVGIVAFVIFSFSNEIALSLSLISEQMGLSTRAFDSIVEQRMMDINESSYRDIIWGNVLNTLQNNKIYLDFNLFVDRIHNGFSVQYVHNLELELLCDFGFIGGGVLIFLLFVFVIRAFMNNWNTEASILLLVYFTSSIMQLQFSNSFLECSVFWLFLGMCATMKREGKKMAIIKNKGLAW